MINTTSMADVIPNKIQKAIRVSAQNTNKKFNRSTFSYDERNAWEKMGVPEKADGFRYEFYRELLVQINAVDENSTTLSLNRRPNTLVGTVTLIIVNGLAFHVRSDITEECPTLKDFRIWQKSFDMFDHIDDDDLRLDHKDVIVLELVYRKKNYQIAEVIIFDSQNGDIDPLILVVLEDEQPNKAEDTGLIGPTIRLNKSSGKDNQEDGKDAVS